MPLELKFAVRWHLEPKAPRLKSASLASTSTGRARWRSKAPGAALEVSKWKRKAVVWKESAETQEYESCQQNDLEVDRDEGMEESSLAPSAIVDANGWHKARFMCNNRCKREGFDLFDIAAILAEDEGRPHTINHCKKCYNLSLAERNEPAVTHARWKAMIGEESSRREGEWI